MAEKVERSCEWCGNSFLTWTCRINRGHGRFCSAPCRAKAVAAMRRGTGGVERTCQQCGSQFRAAKSVIERGRLYCTMACAAKARTKHGLSEQGYVRVTVDGKQRTQHRVVMEQHLGRALKRSEVVHHINGDKTDNRIENLQLMSMSDHMRLHNRRTTWGTKGVTECLDCGTTDRPYLAKGMCSPCYHRHYNRKTRGSKLPSVL